MQSPPASSGSRLGELLTRHELASELTRFLDVEEFVVLYSLSAPFHRLVNYRFSTCLERNAETNAPESAAVFPWRSYRPLCMYDPMRNVLEQPDATTGKARVRDVPSFRWLRMIYFREETVDAIILEMAEAGHRLPAGTSVMLKKLWFLMDYPDTARRIGIVHNSRVWSDRELLLATLFFVKLDMRFTDPLDGAAKLFLRKMMMAQKSLSVLAAVLQRRAMTTMYDFMRMFVEWRIRITDVGVAETVFGIPAEWGGRLMQEGWTHGPVSSNLMAPDELIMKEGIRRDLRLNRWYLDMLLWGNIDLETREDIWPPSMEQRRAELKQQRERHKGKGKRPLEEEQETQREALSISAEDVNMWDLGELTVEDQEGPSDIGANGELTGSVAIGLRAALFGLTNATGRQTSVQRDNEEEGGTDMDVDI